MGTIILGIISVLLESVGATYYKLALNLAELSTNLFKVFALVGNLTVIFYILNFQDFHLGPSDTQMIFLTLGVSVSWFVNAQFGLQILKKEKLSTLLPYNSLDKIFTVILGFFLYTQPDEKISITTFIITLLTIIIIFFFSVDIKKISLPRSLPVIFITHFIRAVLYLTIAYILLSLNSGEYFVIKWFGEGITILLIAFIFRDNFKNLFTQSKEFYITRAIPSVIGGFTYMISLYIIETSGIIIATLLGFLSVAFNILTMKLIAKDTPNRKQVLLAIIVVGLIGFGYYFR